MIRPKEAEIPLRRSELISPNGVGAITTNSDGINMMPGALDFWFHDEIQVEEYQIKEERLKNIFKVKEFRIPPDYRVPFSNRQREQESNLNIQIPMLRFPNYYYCSHCRVMSKQRDYSKDSRLLCIACNNKFARLIQVPLIVACENGHLDDFPWEQWVHEDLNSICKGTLKFLSTGGATLSSMQVVCTACNSKRKLEHLTTRDSKKLYENLEKGKKYKCTGRKPWFGSNSPNDEGCECIPQPILKNATNAYYPQVLNAIYIPLVDQYEVTKIIEHYSEQSIERKIIKYTEKSYTKEEIIEELLFDFPDKLKGYDTVLLEKALDIYSLPHTEEDNKEALNLKLVEYDYLAKEEPFDTSDKLKIVPSYNSKNGDNQLNKFGISQVNLIPKLIETRVLYGFSRIKEPPALSINPDKILIQGKQKLFRHPEKHSWLPAYQVYGEGIFIEFDNELLSTWEDKFFGSKRFSKLSERLRNASNSGIKVKEDVTPRYVLLHTLSHLFIQEIVLSCGYSSSSLKERIYVGPNQDKYMNGFLIYTATGDSEGTMGGLVRLGQTVSIAEILDKAIERARWCSSDPICNEIGMEKGQGRDYVNGASCHNCTYVSEISCEEFNMYLDRGLIASYEKQEDFMSFFEFINLKESMVLKGI